MHVKWLTTNKMKTEIIKTNTTKAQNIITTNQIKMKTK